MDDMAKRRPLERTQDFLSLQRTLGRLNTQLQGGTSIEEIAAWVWFSPPSLHVGDEVATPADVEGGHPHNATRKMTGLRAYIASASEMTENGEEVASFGRFYYASCDPFTTDFLAPLQICRFRATEVDDFQPAERFISGRDLLGRWASVPGGAEAFIAAQVRSTRLSDFHPLSGGTCLSADAGQAYPPLESGLFSMDEIKAIEAQELINGVPRDASMTRDADSASHAKDVRHQHSVIRKSLGGRSNPLKALIRAAQDAALKRSDPESVWMALVEMARRKDPPAPLRGFVEGEGIQWEDDGVFKYLTKKNFKGRLQRLRGE